MNVISEANRIKDRLRACQDKVEVEAVANDERKTVLRWKGQRGDAGAMYLHIINLKMQLLAGFSQVKAGRAA